MIRVLFISLVAVLHLEHSHIWCLADEKNPVCLTPECQKLADYILNNMNKRGEACNNFYDYVCHGWETNHPRPKDEMRWSVGRYLSHQALGKIRKILENTKASANAKVRSAKELYRLCNKIPYMEQSDRDIVRKVILGIQDWPKLACNSDITPDDLALSMIDNYYFKRTGESAFFGFSLRLVKDVEDQVIQRFHVPNTYYGAVERSTKWEDTEKENYKMFLGKLIDAMAPADSKFCKERVGRIVSSVFRFREQLTEIKRKTRNEKLEVMTVKEAQIWHDELTKGIPNAQMNWLENVRVMPQSRRDSEGYAIKDEHLICIQKKYFAELSQLLATVSPSVIANHIHLFFAEAHIIPTTAMERFLRKSVTYTYPLTSIIRFHPERWEWCIDVHAMEETLGKMYIRSYFPMESKLAVEELLDNAKELLKVQIFSSSWLDLNTKQMSEHKINSIESVIGFPNWSESPSKPNRKQPYLSPFKSTAEYMEKYNTIYVTAAYLQMPIYLPNLPYVVNYGATVSMLGHELYHSLDEQGIHNDGHGRSRWWKRDMVNEYIKQSECFADLYTKLKERELEKHGLRVEIDRTLTLSEDISDVMGLKLAYLGFKLQRLKKDGVCPILPGFEKLGCDRLFFISFANIFCGAASNEDMSSLYKNGHSAPKVRVNAAVSSVKEFSEVFNCKKGDRMYLQKPCDLWQKN